MIAVYSPDVPPRPGGVSDHVLALARALAAHGPPPLVLARDGDPGRFAPATCVTGLGPLDAPRVAADRGARCLLLEYVPFLYGRSGIAPALLRLPSHCRRAGITLALFVHEPWVPFTRPAWLLTGLPQRAQLALLARRAAHVYTPVPRFAAMVRRWAGPAADVRVAPVGATIAPSTVDRATARARLGLGEDRIVVGVFSPGASGFAHDWISAAAARLAGEQRVTWILFGNGSASAPLHIPGDASVITVGEADAPVVADTMRALDLAAQPYVDGLTLRRTGAMLALASGVPLVSSTGALYDPVAGALAACEADPAAFADRLLVLCRDPAARAAVAQRALGYPATASVDALAARLRRDLDTA